MAPPQFKTVVRMDKSRPYATVHGDRAPDDRHAQVHFYQNGLPFDARGVLLADHPDVLQSEVLTARAAKLVAKAPKVRQSAPGDDAAGDDDEDNLDEGGGEAAPVSVNLETWATGEEKFAWQDVSNAIAARFAKRVSNKRDAIATLVEQGVVAPGNLSVEHKKLFDQ